MLQYVTEDSWKVLLERQRERESLSLAEGERRFRLQVASEADRGEYSRSSVAKKLLQSGLEPLEAAITQWLEDQKTKRGVRHVAIKWIAEVGVSVSAYMALKVVLDSVTRTRSYTRACAEISDLILDELRYRRLQDQAPALFEYKLRSFRTSSYAHMARSMDHAVRTAKDSDGNLIEVSDLSMSEQHRQIVGAKLVELLVASTSLVEAVEEITDGGKRPQRRLYLQATKETAEWLAQRTDALALLQAQNQPMIVPPLQWAPGQRGGYRFAMRGKYALVRGVRDKTHRQTLATAEMPLVYSAINSLQNTAWRINADVYHLVREIQARGVGIGGIPQSDDEPLPNRPADIDTNADARRKWKRAAGDTRDRNHVRRANALQTQRVLGAAESVLNEEAVFFPYSLDFRGRIYPISDYLHPQGNDLSKALLTFSQGKVLDEGGARWLALHGANCLGETADGKMSKLTLDQREQWIVAHSEQIAQVYRDPFADLWWTEADDPLQFYAFCCEWSRFLIANTRGEEYVCSLPCGMDGSCNGLQHFSAMLKDEIGGAAVNVVPQEMPQDIYQRVADVVLEKLEALAACVEDRWRSKKVLSYKTVNGKREKEEKEVSLLSIPAIAALWLGLHAKCGAVNRKLTKRPTMTFGYGSKRFGFTSQLKDELYSRENWSEIATHFMVIDDKGLERSQVRAACGLMAKLIEDSLAEVVVKAAAAMQWMQKCARGIVKGGRTVEWTVPVTGFRVRQEYVEWRMAQVRTILAGKTVRPVVYLATDKLDPIKQVNAIAPNVVHSLDAAALMLTVSQAAAEGVETFAMVHDSYGSVPTDCALLARCCRQSFIRLYTMQDVVTTLYDQFAHQHADPTQCPEPPEKGDMDLNAVIASDYFFA